MTEHPMRTVCPLELGLCVADLERSLAFYRDTLGFAEVSRIPTPAAFAIASGIAEGSYTVVRLQMTTGERIKLFQPDQAARAGARAATPLSRVGFAFLTLIVARIDAAVDHARACGADVRTDVVNLRPGVRVALIADPDGNVVELVEYDDLGAYRPDLGGKTKVS